MSLLTKGQLVAGNTKAWLGTNTAKELSLAGHTHSNYALTSHTHSGYAATNHTHSQYVSQSTVQSMINNAASSIYYNGNIRKTTFTSTGGSVTITLTFTSSTKFIVGIAVRKIYAFIKGTNGWEIADARGTGNTTLTNQTSTSLTIYINSFGVSSSEPFDFIYVIM